MTRLRTTLLALLFAVPLLAQRPPLPEPKNGVINGRPALLDWPATLRADGRPGAYLPIAGCEVHVARWDEPEKRTLYPCGAWFAPPNGRYYQWLEQHDTISATYTQLLVTGNGERGQPSTYSMVPAGFIALREGHGLGDDVVVRYIHLTRMWRGFIRTELGSTASTPVRMQQGAVIGAMFDRKSNDAIAFIRKVELPAAKTVRVVAEKPKSGTASVFVELKPPRVAHSEPVSLALQIGDRSYPPDAIVDGYRVYAIWYGVEGRSAKLVATHPTLLYDGPEIALRAGAMSTVRGELKSKPSLKISITLDGKPSLPPMSIDVRRPGTKDYVRRQAITAGEPLRIDALDPEPYRVILNIPPWKFARNVDLSDGADAAVEWQLAPLAISGTVHVGKTPTHARVTFMNEGDEWIETLTDDAGAYATTLWLPRDYIVRVHADGQKAPFTSLISVDDSGTFDFNLPDTHYTARVRSAKDGLAIAGATVMVNNTWESAQHGRENVVQRETTDEHGEAVLPALRSGTIQVAAEAKGFQRSESATYTIDGDSTRTLDITLRPVDATSELHILLPDGAPAANAELLATDAGGDDSLWRGGADADGNVELPKLPSGALLLVRHPRAASALRVWRNEVEQAPLKLAAPQEAVTLRIDRRDTARAARLAMWFENIPVRGIALSFLTWSSAATERDGLWTARNLPRAPLRILAWQKTDPYTIASGAFDALATVSPWPMPPLFVVRAIE
ncbi:MAG: hypothetical protein JWO97_1726 [Acidobacteria bacterium]|nr:hypothetical protein [Acidobacteriota bacterium]